MGAKKHTKYSKIVRVGRSVDRPASEAVTLKINYVADGIFKTTY